MKNPKATTGISQDNRHGNTSKLQAAVDVIADFGENGAILPRLIKWSDGRKWPIDKITAVRTQPGGQFLQFTCQIKKQWMYVLLPAQLVS